MRFAVVVVQRPQGQITKVQGAWPAFSSEVAQLKLPAGKSEKPSDNVWLLEMPNASGVLAGVVATAHNYEIPHRVLYFSEPPLEYSFSPSKP